MARVFFEITGNQPVRTRCLPRTSPLREGQDLCQYHLEFGCQDERMSRTWNIMKGQVQILGTGERPSSAQAKVAGPSQSIHEKWDDGSNPDPNTTKVIDIGTSARYLAFHSAGLFAGVQPILQCPKSMNITG
ncbi:predicted protein [Histoplasma capsulatum H143]|uniref:Uncharacterized protein n=1 Tax=Ajellomyces capsulatus (strain H143) TaxID=544712 RepID=C6HD22_AJECH|nr:predicted protein [Histoplasma capsulatum H143]